MKPRRIEQMTESEFRDWIAGTGRAHGWLVHSHDESNVAAPNLILARDGALILARVKAERANVTEAQAEWLDELGRVPGVHVHTFRPSDMAAVFALLSSTAKNEAA